jgi:hypothetical protein
MPRRRAISHGQAERSAQPSLQLPGPGPGVYRLLAGVGNLLGPQSVATRSQNGIALSLLERVSPIEWDNVVLYGQYILTGSSPAGAVPQKRAALSV